MYLNFLKCQLLLLYLENQNYLMNHLFVINQKYQLLLYYLENR
jgi:hypothetical protein